MYVLHLFSGQRRPRDVQFWLEKAAGERNLDIMVLSVDVLLDPVSCNLQDAAAVDRWMKLILSGKVAALLAGPPCETWSRARALSTHCCGAWLSPGARCGTCGLRTPRPLRSETLPWGVPGLRPRERQALELGNQLLRTTVLLAAACHTQQVPFVIEHPESAPDHPSIWKLREMERLRQLDGIHEVSFDQCIFEADGVKPTTLLHGHLPSLAAACLARGRGGRCLHPPGWHIGLRGLSARGSWRTAPAKVYPPGLCELLGQSIVDAVAETWPWLTTSTDNDWDSYGHLYQALDPYKEVIAYGSDTYRPSPTTTSST